MEKAQTENKTEVHVTNQHLDQQKWTFKKTQIEVNPYSWRMKEEVCWLERFTVACMPSRQGHVICWTCQGDLIYMKDVNDGDKMMKKTKI